MTHSSHDLDTLAAKLDALDLTAGERAALRDVFRTALPDDEVEGFAFDTATFSEFLPFFAPNLTLGNANALSARRTEVKDSHDRYG